MKRDWFDELMLGVLVVILAVLALVIYTSFVGFVFVECATSLSGERGDVVYQCFVGKDKERVTIPVASK